MSEDTIFTKIITAGVVTVIASFSSCTAYTNYDDNIAMTKMVEKGADPIDARCAVKGNSTTTCGIRAASKNKNEAAD